LKSDVESELPDKVETVLKCDFSALQRRMYKHMVERGVLLSDPTLNSKGRNKKGFNNTLMQLQKICNHPYLFRDEWAIDRDLVRASGKFDLIDRILPKLRKSGHRVSISSSSFYMSGHHSNLHYY
jgi:SWI/SNF-related matrix-associated actin-dependent regulator of chromatin subfamily A protein 2/4